MTEEDVYRAFQDLGTFRVKEKSSDILFDAALYGEDTVMVRQTSPEPIEFYVINMGLFLEKFEEYLGPQWEY